MAAIEPLEKDLEAFNKALPTLQKDEGKFAVFVDGTLLGVFPTMEEAYTAGFAKAGNNPFLVRRISLIPTIQQFTRMVGFKCLTSS